MRTVDDVGVTEEDKHRYRARDDCVKKPLLKLPPRNRRAVIEIAEEHCTVHRNHGHQVPDSERREEKYHGEGDERHREADTSRLAARLHSAHVL